MLKSTEHRGPQGVLKSTEQGCLTLTLLLALTLTLLLALALTLTPDPNPKALTLTLGRGWIDFSKFGQFDWIL